MSNRNAWDTPPAVRSQSGSFHAISVLTTTTLFPNPAQPIHGIFVETRLRKLIATGQVGARVLAPIPWLPPLVRYGTLGPIRSVPQSEVRDGLTIEHPRYIVLPKVGMNVTPFTLYRAMLGRARQLVRDGHRFDLIDAHYFYPDGVAASWVARRLGLPFVITARGTDINTIPAYRRPRLLIQEAAKSAFAVIAVSSALKTKLGDLGVPDEKIVVLRNGVDLELFRPRDRSVARQKLGLTRRTIASIGHLVARKGHDIAIKGLPFLGDTDLLIVGAGPGRRALEALAAELGVSARVRFLSPMPQCQLSELYTAIDALVLASSSEGWANVLLEAMACGTPVVASNIPGTRDVVLRPEAGLLMRSLDVDGLVDALDRLFHEPPDRAATRKFAEQFDWCSTTEGQLSIFGAAVLGRTSPKRHRL